MSVETELKSLSLSDIMSPIKSSNILSSIKPPQEPTIISFFIDACKNKNYQQIKSLLEVLKYVPSGSIDEHGNTLLHFIIGHYDDFGGDAFFQEFLKLNGIEQILNKLSVDDGITPIMYAHMLKHNNAFDMLLARGADPHIKAKNGAELVTEAESIIQEKIAEVKPVVQEKIAEVKPLIQEKIAEIKPVVQEKITEAKTKSTSIFDSLMNFLKPLTTTETKPLTETSIGMSVSQQVPKQPTSELSTEAFIKGVIDGTISKPKETVPVQQPVVGGSRNMYVGQRMVHRSTFGGSSEETPKSSDKSEKTHAKGQFELERITNDIHDRTVETIKSLMDVDDATARVYKSVIYRRVKKEQPELSGYNRAIEMEKLATKENLEKIDIEAEKKEREETPKSSSETETPKEKKKEKKEKKEKSEKPKKEKKSKKKVESESISSSETSSPDLDTNLTETTK